MLDLTLTWCQRLTIRMQILVMVFGIKCHADYRNIRISGQSSPSW